MAAVVVGPHAAGPQMVGRMVVRISWSTATAVLAGSETTDSAEETVVTRGPLHSLMHERLHRHCGQGHLHAEVQMGFGQAQEDQPEK